MNKIVNKFLLEGDKSMPEMHLRHRGLTYSGVLNRGVGWGGEETLINFSIF